ncbi:MAG: M14-type cytosolic carboxypeptidase, partial [Phycisphaerales bacterium]|nr:M14-type cytosolic carboxypeptidase [Phycisphaerales bacterium]
MLALLLAGFSVTSSFESGALRSYKWQAPDHLVAYVRGEADEAGRNYQPSWFYFSVSGPRGATLTVDIAGLEGEYNFRPHDGSGHRFMRPAYSFDGVQWKLFDFSQWLDKPARIRVRFKMAAERIWIARIPPYTLRHLNSLIGSVRQHPHLTVREIGRSVESRPLHLLTVTNPFSAEETRKTIWLMARQHAWEAGTSWVAEGAIRFLLSDDPEAKRLRERSVFQIIPMGDPDGVFHGGVRFNRNGFDLNRNWDLSDPVRMPEIAAVKKAIENGAVDFFMTLHNTESSDYIQGALAVRGIAERLNHSLAASEHFHALKGPRVYPETAVEKGRMSVDRWVFERTKAPAFLMELMVDPNPGLGRPPDTAD